MSTNKEIYGVLKFTVFCHVIVLVFALVTGSSLTRVSKDVKLQGHQPCGVGRKLWTIHQECLYGRCVTLDTAHSLLRTVQHSS
jgi:hypothetical protein